MIRLIAPYKKPDDEAAFLKHYQEPHIRLVKKYSRPRQNVINRVTASPMGGDPEYFLIAEMRHRDQATFDTAMTSLENRACVRNLMSFDKGNVTLLIESEQG